MTSTLCPILMLLHFFPTLLMCMCFFIVWCVIHVVSKILLLGLLLLLKLPVVCIKCGLKSSIFIHFYFSVQSINTAANSRRTWQHQSELQAPVCTENPTPFRCSVINLKPHLLLAINGWISLQGLTYQNNTDLVL